MRVSKSDFMMKIKSKKRNMLLFRFYILGIKLVGKKPT